MVRADVQGTKERVPNTAVSGTNLDLPGFRPTVSDAVPGVEKYRVQQVIVRIVLNQAVQDSELQYIRTIVPILADFHADRGDRLDLQVIQPGQAARPPFGSPAAGMPLGLSMQEWLLDHQP